MMARRTHGTERPISAAVHGHVHGVEHASRARRRRVPRALAHDRIRVELSTPSEHQCADRGDVGSVVRERELVLRGVSPFGVVQSLQEVRIFA